MLSMQNQSLKRVVCFLILATILLVSCGVTQEQSWQAHPGAEIPTEASRPGVTATGGPEAPPAPTVSNSPEPSQSQAAAGNPGAPREPTAASSPELAHTSVGLSEVSIRLEDVYSGFELPTFITHADDGSQRLFVMEKFGTIRLLPQDTVFLDIRDRVETGGIDELGLLGLAFHPRVEENGYFYVYYTNVDGDVVVSRFRQQPDGKTADPASEYVLFKQKQMSTYHNGGMLAFGPDGYLYIALGDDSDPDEPSNNAQNLQNFLGSILRLDVDGGEPYGIPPDNPFVDQPGARPEIWAYGLRNPWRFSFDRVTHELYIAGVGYNRYESIYVHPAGHPGAENYGWPIVEGSHCVNDPNCDKTGFTLPVAEYEHHNRWGCAIIGGYVYRGEDYPALQGAYLFGDHSTGRIWALARDHEGESIIAEVAQVKTLLSSFGEDERGNMYVVDMLGGKIYRIAVEDKLNWLPLSER